MEEQKFSIPCLFCDIAVQVPAEGWVPTSCGVCFECLAPRTLGQIKVVFLLRSQLVTLHHQVEELKSSIQNLQSAQQDMEQALVAGDS